MVEAVAPKNMPLPLPVFLKFAVQTWVELTWAEAD
jgi:hypothetical protein